MVGVLGLPVRVRVRFSSFTRRHLPAIGHKSSRRLTLRVLLPRLPDDRELFRTSFVLVHAHKAQVLHAGPVCLWSCGKSLSASGLRTFHAVSGIFDLPVIPTDEGGRSERVAVPEPATKGWNARSQNERLCDVVAKKLKEDWSPEQISGWISGHSPTDGVTSVSGDTPGSDNPRFLESILALQMIKGAERDGANRRSEDSSHLHFYRKIKRADSPSEVS